MKLSDISSKRLINQQISASNFTNVKDLVSWMGAVQAQDYQMAKWALGLRVPGSTDKIVEEAINKGDVLRTHVLRPTWHFVSPDDIEWMLKLTAPYVKRFVKSRDKNTGIDENIYSKTNTIIEKLLSDGGSFTSDEIKSELNKHKIDCEENRGMHFLMRAELDGLICSGVSKNAKRTYTLMENRISVKGNFNKEEALEKLARKYFSSHGPATLMDFVWWSGLNILDAKKSLEMIKNDFHSEVIESQTYWLHKSITLTSKKNKQVHLLPAYDEFIISYKDRSAVLDPEHRKPAISSNGVFRPVIVINGKVTGLWRRINKKGKVEVELNLFREHSSAELKQINSAAEKLGVFWEKDVVTKRT